MMNGLDIVLVNIISYLGGILSGIFIHHKMSRKYKKKNDYEDKNEDKEKDFDKYNSPVLAAQAVPSAPPPLNPGFISNNNMNKRITITTE